MKSYRQLLQNQTGKPHIKLYLFIYTSIHNQTEYVTQNVDLKPYSLIYLTLQCKKKKKLNTEQYPII